MNTLKNCDSFGIKVDNYEMNVEQIQKRKQHAVDQLVEGIEKIIKARGIELLRGRGRLLDKNTVHVTLNAGGEQDITSKNIIIATGSRPSIPKIPGADSEGVITSDEILNFKEVPKRLAVAGSGVIGIEFAYIFNSLGSEVSVISSTLLKRTDKDIVKRLPPILKRQGIKLYDEVRAKEIVRGKDGLVIRASSRIEGKPDIEIEADYLLMASGREPVVEGLDLDKLGIAYDGKGIHVDENYETNVRGIFAIGDVIGGNMLAHVASHEGIHAVEHIMGITSKVRQDVVPDCIFISPQIAYVGMTEEKAKEKGLDYKVSKFMFGANGKALAMGEPEGFVKVISSGENNKIIGVHIMGPHASDLIHEGALAIANDMNAENIAITIHAHPTLGEAFSEAVAGLSNEAVHMLPRR
jgi:dihydrolipoamide dehydrogenase